MNNLPQAYALIPIAALAMVCVIVGLTMRAQQERTAAQRDVQLALLQKFGSADELSRFLATSEGKQFTETIMLDQSQLEPRRKVLQQLTSGIVLIALGIGFCILGPALKVLWIPGIICLSIGIALLIACAITYRLARKMGLIA